MCAVIGATLPRLMPSSDSLDVILTSTKVVDLGDALANIKPGEEKENNRQRKYYVNSYAEIEKQACNDAPACIKPSPTCNLSRIRLLMRYSCRPT